MANRYWVGGTASWDGVIGTKWSATSGGAGGASIPTSTDDVFFDASSGAVTVSVDNGDVPCKNLTFTGFTGTFAGSGFEVTISGSLVMGSGMTRTYTGVMDFISSSAETLTFNGITFAGSFVFNGTGSWTLQDAFTNTSSISLTQGTLDTNGKNCTFSTFSSTNSNTRTLTLGSSMITLTSTGTIWNFTIPTNLTLNPGSSTIKVTNTGNSTTTFAGGGKTFNNLWYSRSASTGSNTISGSNTFSDLKDDGSAAHSLLFVNGTTTTVTTFTVSGSVGKLITINSDNTSTHSLVKSGGGTISCDYLSVQHSVATPATTWYAGANSTNNQAVATAGSGWIFTIPPPTTFIKTLEDLAYASTKTVMGLAIASMKTWEGLS